MMIKYLKSKNKQTIDTNNKANNKLLVTEREECQVKLTYKHTHCVCLCMCGWVCACAFSNRANNSWKMTEGKVAYVCVCFNFLLTLERRCRLRNSVNVQLGYSVMTQLETTFFKLNSKSKPAGI